MSRILLLFEAVNALVNRVPKGGTTHKATSLQKISKPAANSEKWMGVNGIMAKDLCSWMNTAWY